MPCRQVSTYNGFPGSGPTTGGAYATEAACNQACKEGACCTGTTCSVKPQCQCQGTGQTFKGIGTTCTPNPCVGPCCVAGVCSLKTVAECASLGGTMQSGTVCTCFTCGMRPVSVSVTIEETYTADAFSVTFAPHRGTMMPFNEQGVPATDFKYRTHNYQTPPNYAGNPVHIVSGAGARLRCVGDQSVFALTNAGLSQFDPAISYNFYGCTITGSYGAGFYQRASGSDGPSSQLSISESWIGKTKDNMWDWLVGKVFTGTYYTYQYCYLNPTAHDRVDMKLTIDSVQYL